MNLLILGGTQFLGKHVVESALEAGHHVTIFNRGKTNEDYFPNVEKRKGDRNGDLASLKEGNWDAVIDVSGYTPSQVKATAELLKNRVKQYVFISTISVYGDFANGPAKEDETALAKMEGESEEITGSTYGPLKQKCEEIIKDQFGHGSLCIRPGLIVGPDDPTDRFTYWVERTARGGEVAAPGEPSRAIQWIDVRDLAQWVIRMTEKRTSGTFNAAGPAGTMDELLRTAKQVTGSTASFKWIEDQTLLEHEVAVFMEMPFWIPRSDSHPDGFIMADAQKAIEKGLTFRSPEETIRDTYHWQAARKDHSWKAGLAAEKERKILQSMDG
ncbi:NAD-dependent epimerase/dehydratase family protein [Jeotgalibacillus campisalis]|uniref:UDP-glucose 4-epimerase n=1 Tax=Jeotgalibacillus campisalis TaxID=220754 RepID=A0A0C2VWD9_9BACL|nr:NAD-dependent epimerase/dehydratase family protein [Jeotgalibacillus campisalis]KIL48726.1 putative isoflavone reductase [Jeotgalibacillus campisalis]